jgi:hypothetical protein
LLAIVPSSLYLLTATSEYGSPISFCEKQNMVTKGCKLSYYTHFTCITTKIYITAPSNYQSNILSEVSCHTLHSEWHNGNVPALQYSISMKHKHKQNFNERCNVHYKCNIKVHSFLTIVASEKQ